MQTQDIGGSSNSEYLRAKYPCYNYAIHFLESEEIAKRRLGYALLAPLFRTLPEEVKELIRYVWQNETEKGKIPYSFAKCCKKIFMEED